MTIKEAEKRVFIYKDIKCINLGCYSGSSCIITPINKNISRDDKTVDAKFWKIDSHPDNNVQRVINSQPIGERSSYYYAIPDHTPVTLFKEKEEETRNEKYLFPLIESL